ncbi:MAG: M14 family zinc carboxypeptidase [Saprospiraceae bacterium]
MNSMFKQALYLFFGLCPLWVGAQIQWPGDFLPHPLGAQFTPHHLLVDYFQHIADQSDQVQLMEYGATNEDRPLLLAFVSTPANLANLEAIRLNHLRKAGLIPGTPDPALDRAIVWLSFSVHGNEAAGAEASMAVVYDLANPIDPRTQAWLQNTIVIIDPALNPDGYSRYTHWYRGVANRYPDIHPSAREHREPWPGGRVNHYLFDLNRDWAWQTQVESRQRVAQYLQWMPHIHADLHEQYYFNPYYFAPAAQPYHDYITDWQADFQTEIGKNHARYFDKNGWLYFTREVFDLLYPSYGDTYPTFNGSIGMTYEQGGHSRGGTAIVLPNHDTLTLDDRVTHHRTTALSTVEMASNNATRISEQFANYFQKTASNPAGPYKTYIIKGDNPRHRIAEFMAFLDRNGITYGHVASRTNLSALHYQTKETLSVTVNPSDLVISAYQPRSVMVQVLLDPVTTVVDSLTYDITAWSLPYAFGLEAYASTSKIQPETGYELPPLDNQLVGVQDAYAYTIPWESMKEAHFLAQLLKAGIQVRTTSTGFQLKGREYAPGTLIVTRADNRKRPHFDEEIQSLEREYQVKVEVLPTGFTDKGPDLGSASMTLLKAPRVAMLAGEGTYTNETGQVWYYFEQRLDYPIRILYPDDLQRWSGEDVDILILPEGQYDITGSVAERLSSWVRSGGKLLAIGDALSNLTGHDTFGLHYKANTDNNDPEPPYEDHTYANAERRSIADANPGAIFSVAVDDTHPLGYGLGNTYFTLKIGTSAYAPLEDGWNVGTIGDAPLISGFVGSNVRPKLNNTLVFGVKDHGRGSFVYLVDNPLFRGFWEQGNFLFSNAVFMTRN